MNSEDIIKNMKEEKESLRVVSLFSGCGGLDLGFEGGFSYLGQDYTKNNFDIVFANDIVPQACETFKNRLLKSVSQISEPQGGNG